jgi:hypothetical protein
MHLGKIKLQRRDRENETDVNTLEVNAGTLGSNVRMLEILRSTRLNT